MCGCAHSGTAVASTCYCSVEDLLRVIRRRYSLALMNAIRMGQPARFRDLEAMLPQASTSTLAETLSALEAASLVAHHTAHEVPTSHYRLTPSGETLLSRFRALLEDVSR